GNPFRPAPDHRHTDTDRCRSGYLAAPIRRAPLKQRYQLLPGLDRRAGRLVERRGSGAAFKPGGPNAGGVPMGDPPVRIVDDDAVLYGLGGMVRLARRTQVNSMRQ